MQSPSSPAISHITSPTSPWPILLAMGILLLTIGIILTAHKMAGGWGLFGCGSVVIFAVIGGWVRDVLIESTHQTGAEHSGLRLCLGAFIISEIMIFVAFFWALFHTRLMPALTWPPGNISPINPFGLPYLNTLILLLSGILVSWSHHDLSQGTMQKAFSKLGYAILLGIGFLCLQAIEFHEAPFSFQGGIYPSLFFMLTGLHGVHVILGVLFLIIALYRLRQGAFLPHQHFGFEAAAWYWHFVDGVWIILFLSLYL